VVATLVWDGPASEEEFVGNYPSPRGDPSHRHFTIAAGGVPVGSLSIRPGFQPGRGDIGYWVGEPFQGKGYATKAVARALAIAFGEMGMEKVEACAFLGNRASRRVLEKCGFRDEGIVRKAVLKRGRWLDEWLLGITREDWLARGGLQAGGPAGR
jgi:ribosomal-protein-alanine N-acetyltransferase